MEHLSVDEVSEKWSISRRHIQILCLKVHINGTVRIGKSVEFQWMAMFVPKGVDAREDPIRDNVYYGSLEKHLLTCGIGVLGS